MSGRLVRLEREGGVGRLVLDRPPLNVLDIPMLEELRSALTEVERDRGLKVLAVQGEGRAFSAGVDVADHTRELVEQMLQLFHDAVRRVMALEVPVVAAIRGPALGGGLELALACDVLLARDDAKLGQPEIKLAVFPPVAAALLPRLIGRQRAADLILTGRVLGAEEARQWGLVSHVYAADRFDDEVECYLRTLAGMSAPALRLAKHAMVRSSQVTVNEGLDRAESLYLNELMALEDSHEGIAAFLEKRQPVWRDL